MSDCTCNVRTGTCNCVARFSNEDIVDDRSLKGLNQYARDKGGITIPNPENLNTIYNDLKTLLNNMYSYRNTFVAPENPGSTSGKISGQRCVNHIQRDNLPNSLGSMHDEISHISKCSCNDRVTTICNCHSRTFSACECNNRTNSCSCVSRSSCTCNTRGSCNCVNRSSYGCYYRCRPQSCSVGEGDCTCNGVWFSGYCSCNARGDAVYGATCSCNTRTTPLCPSRTGRTCVCDGRCSCNMVTEYSVCSCVDRGIPSQKFKDKCSCNVRSDYA